MVPLHWICGVGKHYGSFVQRRVAEIRSLVGHENWCFIDSGSNSADILSSGALFSNLKEKDLLYSGPKQVLYSDIPPTRFSMLCKDYSFTLLIMDTPSTKKEKLVNLNNIIDVERFSSYLQLLRVTSCVMHFINRLTNNLKNSLLDLHLVDSVELKKAEILWIKPVQHDLYDWKQFKQLNADLRFFIEDDILRCKRRISNASLPHDSKNPIYLPKCDFSTPLVKFNHFKVLHNGIKDTLNELRTRFWISKTRKFISSVIKNCFICKKVEGPSYKYPAAPDLQSTRVAFAPAFTHTSVDYDSQNMYKA